MFLNNAKRYLYIVLFQDLAGILIKNGLIQQHDIISLLGVKSYIPASLPAFSGQSQLEEWEMACLSRHISGPEMKAIARKNFSEHFETAELDNISSDNRHSWSTSFEILVRWSRKTGNNREVNVENVQKYFGLNFEYYYISIWKT